MSYAKFEREFGDGTYTFDLSFNLASEFEQKHGKSLWQTMKLLVNGVFSIEDLSEIVRLALIGGGTEPGRAMSLVQIYVRDRPLAEHINLSRSILSFAFFGEDEAK
jgi:hypothetical protein